MIFELHTFVVSCSEIKVFTKKVLGNPPLVNPPPPVNYPKPKPKPNPNPDPGGRGIDQGGIFRAPTKNMAVLFLYLFRDISSSNDTHMENLIQYKNSLKYKVGCF